jgi:cyclic pyranopterin phosphate synthase
MVDIRHKHNSSRTALAEATVVCSAADTITQIKNRLVPKGDVLEFARAAGLLAIKKTADVIPDCHPLPIEFSQIRYELGETTIRIEVEVGTIYKTGVEVEAMHGASVTALTLYDMLKPIDKGIEIQGIRLVMKKGGKSSYSHASKNEIKAAVVVCSDSVFAKKKEDQAGKTVVQELERHQIQAAHYTILPDEVSAIQTELRRLESEQYDMVLITGGTGLSVRDTTPEAVRPLLTREIPGLMEAARNYGMQRTPYAMLSRGIAGMMNSLLVVTLPGSTQGAKESMQALFPAITHLFEVQQGARHDNQ